MKSVVDIVREGASGRSLKEDVALNVMLNTINLTNTSFNK